MGGAGSRCARSLASRSTSPRCSRTASRPQWWPGAVELGLTGLALPEDVGGSGASVVELAVAVEELGATSPTARSCSSAVAGLVLAAARAAAADDQDARRGC